MDRMSDDWVVEISSTQGLDDYTLGGAPPGTSYFTFRQRIEDGRPVRAFYVRNPTRTKWEKNQSDWPNNNLCTLTYGVSPGTDVLARNVVESSSGDAPINWGPGDMPLRIYIASDSAADDGLVSGNRAADLDDIPWLRAGLWRRESTPSAGYSRLEEKFDDEDVSTPVGVINEAAHQVTIYGTPRNWIDGLILSRNSGTPTTKLDVSAGEAMDSTNVICIRNGSTITKRTNGAWVAGNDTNGMGNSLTIANSTWYHVFSIINNGVTDVYFDTSISAANKPAGTTHFRRIGSFKTDGSAQIVNFTQVGETFLWATPVLDVSAGSLSGGVASTKTVSVPADVAVLWIGGVNFTDTGSIGAIGKVAGGAFAVGKSTTNYPFQGGTLGTDITTSYCGGQLRVLTNTSAQIDVIGTGGGTLTCNVITEGWVDRRGRG